MVDATRHNRAVQAGCQRGAGMNRIGWFAALSLAISSTPVLAASFACMPNNNPPCMAPFPIEFSGSGIPSDIGFVLFSSPAVARLGLIADNVKDIVVGTTTGYVVAYHGDGTFLWARKTGAVGISGKPAIADIDGDGIPEIVVGTTDLAHSGGGVHVLRRDGTIKCSFTALDEPAPGAPNGIFSSPALGRLDATRPNERQIVFGGWDHKIRALRADCSLWWSKGAAEDVIDTVWSSPALYDLDRDGQVDVIIGQDSGQGTLPNGRQVGGQVRAFRGHGVGELPGFPIKLDDVVYSSPAIGDIAGNGGMSIVTGFGRCWDMPSCAPDGVAHQVSTFVYGWKANGSSMSGWPYAVSNQSARQISPALADLDGDGKLETITSNLIKTSGTDQDGVVHVIRSNGTPYPGWPKTAVTAATCTTNNNWLDSHASPIVVDLNGDGAPEIIEPSANYLLVWDRNGNQISRVAPAVCSGANPTQYQMQGQSAFFSTPTAADLHGDGKIVLVVAGASSNGIGALYAWKFPNSVATPANMPWPQFRHDAMNTGVYLGDVIFRNGFEATP
ncbi:MAG: VCBS repeat-containing protein [Dokdonella sp.]|nr:VCBS repeat-containing protein [Dokdonella sp.]